MRSLSTSSLPLLSATVAALLFGACKGNQTPNGESASAGASEEEAVTPVPPATGPVTLENLLTLLPAGKNSFMVVREPSKLFDYAVTTTNFYEQPLAQILAKGQTTADKDSRKELASANKDYTEVKNRLDTIQKSLSSGEVKLDRGMLFVSVGDKRTTGPDVAIFGASSLDGARALMTAVGVGEKDGSCKDLDGVPGYVICGKNEATVASYKPGLKGAVTKAALQTSLPGVALDKVAIATSIRGDRVINMAMTVTGSDMELHVGSPTDITKVRGVVTSGKADLLRFVQPETGFMWAHINPPALRKRFPELKSIPPSFDSAIDQLTGEILVGGLREPSALQIRLGSNDLSTFKPAFDMAAIARNMVPKTLPKFEGSKVALDSTTIPHPSGDIKALHLGASGLTKLDSLRRRLGLSFDVWLFAADGALSMIAGADAEAVKSLTTGSHNPGSSLPPTLAKSMAAGEAVTIVHVPIDSLYGPLLQSLLEEAQAKGVDIDPELFRMSLGIVAPFSSFSLWITDVDDTMTIHVAARLIGDPTTEEGQAAFNATRDALVGGDSKALFEALATRFPDSPRVANYKVRAGSGGAGDLIGSAIGAPIAAVLGVLAAFGDVLEEKSPT